MRHPNGRPVALTIAGSDSSGGAGIQADLKTFSALGVYGASVISAITAQNTRGVRSFELVSSQLFADQLAAVFEDTPIGAAKTGMLGDPELIRVLGDAIESKDVPLVVDPVMVATSGDSLVTQSVVDAYLEGLFRHATVITPNLDEAGMLLGCAPAVTRGEMENQAGRLLKSGCRAVLLKGGHLGDGRADDLLFTRKGQAWIEGSWIDTPNTHGTGCTLSAAIAAYLAAGFDVEPAVRAGKQYLQLALEAGRRLRVGEGSGPVDHVFAIEAPDSEGD